MPKKPDWRIASSVKSKDGKNYWTNVGIGFNQVSEKGTFISLQLEYLSLSGGNYALFPYEQSKDSEKRNGRNS